MGGTERCSNLARDVIAGQPVCGYHADAIRADVLEGSLVYYLERDGLLKIGISHRPADRARALRATLLAVERGGRAREREMHTRFVHLAVRGEWFADAPEIRSHIATVRRSNGRLLWEAA